MSSNTRPMRPKPLRSTVVLNATGLLLALWLGLTAPSVTPVAGPPATRQLAPLVPGAG